MPKIDRKPKAKPVQAPESDAGPDALDLIPGFRDRLLQVLDAAGIPPRRRVAELRRITGRASPSVRRWIDADYPGLPDLESFARLCHSLPVEPSEFLGLSADLAGAVAPADAGNERWLQEVRRAATRSLEECEPFVMAGDDMAPRISDGDVVFVDSRVTTVAGNGVYVIEFKGRPMVRNIEDRLSAGVLLRCANPRYADVAISLKNLEAGVLAIRGKVLARLSVAPV